MADKRSTQGVAPRDYVELARRAVIAEREQRHWSVRKAALAGGTSNETWARFERGETQSVTEAIYLAVKQAFGWPDDWPTNPPDAQTPHTTTSAPPDISDTLNEILSEIRTHRASDIAPAAHLLDMPTRAEFTAALESLRGELRAGVDAMRETRDVEIDGLRDSVANLDKRLRAVEAPPPGSPSRPATPRSAPAARRRTDTSNSRTTRSADR